MKLNFFFTSFSILISSLAFAQVPNDFNVNSNGSAERVARFKVKDEPFDFLEITNSTNHSGKFIPSIWAHQQSDSRYVLRHFASTLSTLDYGNNPLMVFRAELRDGVNVNAPSGGVFPWGTQASSVSVRPVFAWENGNSRLMTIKANGNLGLGTTNPTALLHTLGTVRFQNLPNATTPTYLLGTDASGNVKEYPANTGGGVKDVDWYKARTSVSPTSIKDDIYTYGSVGVNTSSPTARLHTVGTVRMEKIQLIRENPKFLLGIDEEGNITRHQQLTIFLKEMKETIEKQQNQITLLHNKISNLEKFRSTDVKETKTSFSTNFPNPFSTITNIEYMVLKKVKDAKIIIYNSNGTAINTYNLKERELKGKLTIDKKGMKSGIYFYTMIADGIVIGTKKMIVK